LLFVQELWRGDDADLFALIRDRLSMSGEFVALAHGERVTEADGGRGWQRWSSLMTGDEGLYFAERRPLSKSKVKRRQSARGVEEGDWGVGLFSTFPMRDVTNLRPCRSYAETRQSGTTSERSLTARRDRFSRSPCTERTSATAR
jgi:hypothetical protein